MFEPGPLDPESSTLTIRVQCVSHEVTRSMSTNPGWDADVLPIPQHNPPKAQNGGFGDCHHVAAPPHEKGDSIHTSKKNLVLGDY